MQQELHIAPAGLFTDPSDETAPPGALLTANNVVIRRKGVVEPRPGFDIAKTLSLGSEVRRAVPFDDDLLMLTHSSGAFWYSDKSEAQDEDDSSLSDIDDENFRGVQAAGNLYLPFSDGVRKVTAALDDEAEKTGAPFPGFLIFSAEAAGSAVANGKVVRYRALLKREDANGLVLRSIPTAPMLYDNDAGATQKVTLVLILTSFAKASDIVELYRSADFSTGTVPDEECLLVLQQTITSTDITNGTVTLVDDLALADAGSTIYSAPSQEGARQENHRPPKCYDMASFKGSMFYGRTTGPHRVTLVVAQANDANQVGDTTGIGIRTTTGDTTNGSDQLTNIGDASGVAVGQYISPENPDVPAGTYVTAIAGTTATMSNNATGTTLGGAVSFIDTITVGDGTNYTMYQARQTVNDMARYMNYGPDSAYIVVRSETAGPEVVARSLTQYPHDAYPGTKGTLVIEAADIGGSQFYVWATHSEAYFEIPNEPTYSGGLVLSTTGGVTSDNDDRPHGIMWSKNGQPEHVPETGDNYKGVGSKAHVLQRIIPTKDALFIFKTDGIWRLTGAGEQSGWRVDEFDLSTRLIRPDCAVEMDGAIYAWTNKGVVRITDAGVTLLSASAIGKDLRSIQIDLLSDASVTPAAFMATNPKDREILLSVPSGGGGTYVSTLYVFNTVTLAWTTWDLPSAVGEGAQDTFLVYNPSDAKLYHFTGTNSEVHKERITTSDTDYTDRDFSIVVSAVSGTDITISAGSGWTPAVGDKISSGIDTYISAVTDATNFAVEDSGVQTGSGTAWASYQSDIEWVAKTAKNPGLAKHYMSGAYVFGRFSNIARATYKWTSSLSTTPTSVTETFTRSTDDISRTCRFPVPSAHARVSHLFPEIEIRQAMAGWELTGLSLWFEAMDERGVNR